MTNLKIMKRGILRSLLALKKEKVVYEISIAKIVDFVDLINSNIILFFD